MNANLLLSPELRARLADLSLYTRHRAVGHGVGQHASQHRGAGLEFAQYRGYEPGDEPRRIDWKLYARSDRFFVREAERDSPLTLWIVLDASASMALADAEAPHYSKWAAACRLAACLIELALRQGDQFGLIVLAADGPLLVPAAAGARQRDRCLLALAPLQARGVLPDLDPRAPLWRPVAADHLVVCISDGFDEHLISHCERLASARRDVVLLRLLSVGERDFPFQGDLHFRDPESGAERRVDAAATRTDFLRRFGEARRALSYRLDAAGIRHVEHVLDESVDAPLRRLFAANAAAKP